MRKITLSFIGGILLLVSLSFTFSALTPNKGLSQYTEYGIATYYSDLFEGRKTSSGEVYHQNQLTAAHKSLPYGTIVRVTRLDNKKSIKVRINDRGAFNKGRIIDLSKAAAQRLDMVNDGKANVKLEVLNEATVPKTVAINEAPSGKNTTKADLTPKSSKPKASAKSKANAKSKTKPKSKVKTAKTYHLKGPKKSKKATSKASYDSKELEGAEILTGSNYHDFDLYKVQVMRPKKAGFGVQVGLLENYENVFKFIADLQEDFFKNILLSVEEGPDGSQYRIILGPFPTKDQAQSYRNSLAKKKKLNGFVVSLKNLAKAR